MIDRVLANSPNNASPGKVVAAELAFAREAREKGQWTAFRAFMGPNAVLHGERGPVAAASWLGSRPDPAEAHQWTPRGVWMSCDGHLAVSRGRLLDPQGDEGSFVTVWRRQSGGQYLWIYDIGAARPLPEDASAQSADGAIVVVAEEMIQGYVADCPSAARPMPARPEPSVADGTQIGGGASPDGTLHWRWEQQADGTRRVVADFLSEGSWKVAVKEDFPPAAAQ